MALIQKSDCVATNNSARHTKESVPAQMGECWVAGSDSASRLWLWNLCMAWQHKDCDFYKLMLQRPWVQLIHGYSHLTEDWEPFTNWFTLSMWAVIKSLMRFVEDQFRILSAEFIKLDQIGMNLDFPLTMPRKSWKCLATWLDRLHHQVGELSHELCRKQRRGCAMQVPLQGLWAVGYCWNVNWNVLVVFWLSCSWILLSVCSVGFSMGVFERINTGVVGLERGSSTASKEPGERPCQWWICGWQGISLDANIGECCLDLECFFFRIQENHSFNRQSPGFLANPRGCCWTSSTPSPKTKYAQQILFFFCGLHWWNSCSVS